MKRKAKTDWSPDSVKLLSERLRTEGVKSFNFEEIASKNTTIKIIMGVFLVSEIDAKKIKSLFEDLKEIFRKIPRVKSLGQMTENDLVTTAEENSTGISYRINALYEIVDKRVKNGFDEEKIIIDETVSEFETHRISFISENIKSSGIYDMQFSLIYKEPIEVIAKIFGVSKDVAKKIKDCATYLEHNFETSDHKVRSWSGASDIEQVVTEVGMDSVKGRRGTILCLDMMEALINGSLVERDEDMIPGFSRYESLQVVFVKNQIKNFGFGVSISSLIGLSGKVLSSALSVTPAYAQGIITFLTPFFKAGFETIEEMENKQDKNVKLFDSVMNAFKPDERTIFIQIYVKLKEAIKNPSVS